MRPTILLLALSWACTPEMPAPDSPVELAGDWRLVSIVSPQYNAEVGPTPTPPIVKITASPASAEGQVAGTDGCNEWYGEYSVPAGGQIKVGSLARTLKMCLRVYTLQEGGYAGEELSAVSQFTINGSTLVLFSDDNKTRLTFRLP